MIFKQLIDAETSTYTYVLADEKTKKAIIIDPVIENIAEYQKIIEEYNLKLLYILETHVHADHITGGGLLKKAFPNAQIALGKINNLDCADRLLNDGETLSFGEQSIETMQTPGHTAGCVSYKIENIIFTGDLLLINSAGRTDFQEGDNQEMFQNIQKIYKLPDDTIIYPAHDYNGNKSTTVGEQKTSNPIINADTTLGDFSHTMDNLNLDYPKKIDVSLPANKLCGE